MATATKIILPDGLTVMHERNRLSRAFCVGVWTRTGARDERSGEEGLCHFLEHMLFKGTERRSAQQISQEIERVGGALDAFTTKETMCVYAQVLEERRQSSLDLISDMLRHSAFADDAVALEREVVLEEIGDVEDAPDDLIHELFADALFPRHPMGKPILGTRRSVSSFTRADVERFGRRTLRASNVVVALYGNAPEDEILHWCEGHLDFPGGPGPRRNGRPARVVPRRRSRRRPLKQQHLCIGTRTFSFHDERRFALMVLTTLVGGGMSSRLFQRIREELGLTYSIFTYADHSRDTGLMATYMAVRPANVARVIREVLGEFARIREGDIDARDLEDTKAQLQGRILLGLETSVSRMMRLARNELSYGRQMSERELVARIEGVTREDVMEVADEFLDPRRQTIVSIGPTAAGLRTRLR
jgi:predicted Zn-dependent peptidase